MLLFDVVWSYFWIGVVLGLNCGRGLFKVCLLSEAEIDEVCVFLIDIITLWCLRQKLVSQTSGRRQECREAVGRQMDTTN